jgi:Sulfotransferase domain
MSLFMSGLRGQGNLGDNTFIVKTHLPLYLQEEPMKANKVIVCYRNPEESILSLF